MHLPQMNPAQMRLFWKMGARRTELAWVLVRLRRRRLFLATALRRTVFPRKMVSPRLTKRRCQAAVFVFVPALGVEIVLEWLPGFSRAGRCGAGEGFRKA